VLKTGGELYFSDVYADRELSEELKNNKVLWGWYFNVCAFEESLKWLF